MPSPAAWTDNDRETVKALLAQGKSASAIAALFNITRNAVVGRVQRDAELAFLHSPGREDVVIKRIKKERKKKALEVFVPRLVSDPKQKPGTMLLVPLGNLGPNQCRWPVKPAEVTGKHLFCGRMTAFGEVYCEAHKRMAHPKGGNE